MIDVFFKKERSLVLMWAAFIVLVASLPYIWGICITPPGYRYLGLTHNIDDGAVYLSWMRQAADGHFFIRNLFTNEPQAARQFNLLFLLMGNFVRFSHLSLIFVFHLFRVILGIVFLLAVWQFSKLFLDDSRQRLILIPLIGLSSGLGWLFVNAQSPTGPVDVWQPEAITFLSIYLNPLFLAGLILMLGSLYFLTLAHRDGRVVYAIYAGLMLLLLGNIHTYDVISVGCIWAAYVLSVAVISRKFPAKLVLFSLIAAAMSLPSVGYQYYLYHVDEVFKARANSPTPSPAIWSFFIGYGLILIGAIYGCLLSVRKIRRNGAISFDSSKLLLVVWGMVGFVLPYIPVGQQRKLVMGLHIPLCILCAYGLSKLLETASVSMRRVVLLSFVSVAAISNAIFMAKDMSMLNNGDTAPHYAAYFSSGQFRAYDYLRSIDKPDITIFADPSTSLFTPAYTGHQVYYGHWSETPNYMGKIKMWGAFTDKYVPQHIKEQILKESSANYIIWVDMHVPVEIKYSSAKLGMVFTADPVTIFKVRLN